MKKKVVLEIAIIGIMAALAIVLEKFSFPRGNSYLKFTFYGLPLLVVGCMYGARVGLITGIVSSFIMQLTSEYGLTITTPLWMIAPICWGGVSGLVFYLLKRKNNIPNMIIVSFVTSIFATLFNTVAMILEGLIFGGSYYALSNILANLPPRLISMVILAICYTFILWILIKRLSFLTPDASINEETDESDEEAL